MSFHPLRSIGLRGIFLHHRVAFSVFTEYTKSKVSPPHRDAPVTRLSPSRHLASLSKKEDCFDSNAWKVRRTQTLLGRISDKQRLTRSTRFGRQATPRLTYTRKCMGLKQMLFSEKVKRFILTTRLLEQGKGNLGSWFKAISSLEVELKARNLPKASTLGGRIIALRTRRSRPSYTWRGKGREVLKTRSVCQPSRPQQRASGPS